MLRKDWRCGIFCWSVYFVCYLGSPGESSLELGLPQFALTYLIAPVLPHLIPHLRVWIQQQYRVSAFKSHLSMHVWIRGQKGIPPNLKSTCQ